MATGAIPGFNATEFREGIRIPMLMSMPQDEEQRPEFVHEGTVVSPGDADGVPWDINAEPVVENASSERVLCAITYFGAGEDQREWGTLQPGDIEIVLLDEEYEVVKGFDYVNLWTTGAGEPVRYDYVRVAQALNLDAVGVWVLLCHAKDLA